MIGRPSGKTHIALLLTLSLTGLAPLLTEARELVRIWETDPVMDKPESAAWDASTGRIFISSIGGDYLQIDGNGYISVIDADGHVLDAKWYAEGLNNPQGLVLDGDKLYIADLTRVVVLNTKNASQLAVIPAEGAQFLNDVTKDADGSVFVSDCKINRIYRIRDGLAEVWTEDAALNGPNGLLAEKERILALNFNNGTIHSIERQTKQMTMIAEGIANADGITSDGEGGYFASGAWQGEVFHIDSDGRKTLVLNLGQEKTIAADILYIPEKHLLVIPTLNKMVLGYRWE
jgi:sugar lactone lactonase YvrE